jgi:hypothetical protein
MSKTSKKPDYKTPPKELREFAWVQLRLDEADNSGKTRVEGEFARCGEPTQNKRVYEQKLWEREMLRLEQALADRRLFGELDHPCLQNPEIIKVLTENGWKLMTEVQVGDRVWSNDNGQAVLSRVEAVIHEEYDGPIYNVKGRSIDQGFTPAHKFLLSPRQDSKNPGPQFYATIEEIYNDRAKFSHCYVPNKIVLDQKESATVNKPEVADLPSNTINLDDKSLEISKNRFKGPIGCLTTTHGNFYVECNGKNFWTGNSDGKTSLSRVSHIVTGMRVEDGRVIGEAEILPTSRGNDLMALLKAGCKVGVSSRGYGSTKPDEYGNDIVQEDYKLVTFDFVAEPADKTAYPEPYFEGLEIEMAKEKITEETREEALEKEQEMAKKFAQAIEDARNEERDKASSNLREEFNKTLVQEIAKMKDELRESVRGEMLTDPSIAGAKTAMDRVRDVLRPYILPEDAETVVQLKESEIRRLKEQLAEKELDIVNLQDEMEKLAEVAKEAGYKLYLERNLAGNPNADLLRKMIGDVTSYNNAGEIQDKLASIEREMEARSAKQEAIERERQEAQALFEEREYGLQSQLNQVVEALNKSAELNKELGLRLYLRDQLTNHPKGARIKSLVESNMPSTKEEIDAVINEFRIPMRDPEQLEHVRSRIRNRMHGGYSTTAADEETPSFHANSLTEDYQGLGMSLADMRHLSGMDTGKNGKNT